MTENLTEQDKSDLAQMGIEVPEDEVVPQHSLLFIWRDLLSHVPKSAAEPIPMVVAHKVVNSWPKLTYQDTAKYHVLYHQFLQQAADLVDEAIAKRPEAIDFVGEDDLTENGKTYLDLLVQWHLALDRFEHTEWRAEDEDSHIKLAAVIDARATLFSDTGLTGHLDAIHFRVTDEEFLAAVEAAKEAQ